MRLFKIARIFTNTELYLANSFMTRNNAKSYVQTKSKQLLQQFGFYDCFIHREL